MAADLGNLESLRINDPREQETQPKHEWDLDARVMERRLLGVEGLLQGAALTEAVDAGIAEVIANADAAEAH